MSERLLDVIKYGLIIIIAGIVFYIVYPKYDFKIHNSSGAKFRCNKMTGTVEIYSSKAKTWKILGKENKN